LFYYQIAKAEPQYTQQTDITLWLINPILTISLKVLDVMLRQVLVALFIIKSYLADHCDRYLPNSLA